MIIESRAVGPFMKNGFIVACEDTREAVFIDPGDEVQSLLAFVRAAEADSPPYPADACARRSCDGRRGGEERARCSRLSAPRRPVPVRPRRRVRSDVRPAGANRSRRSTSITRLARSSLSGRSKSARTIRRGIVPAASACRSEGRARPAWSCSSATRSSPGRSAGLTCRGATTRRSSPRSAPCCSRFGDEAVVHPGHGPDTTIGRERRTNPFLVGQD